MLGEGFNQSKKKIYWNFGFFLCNVSPATKYNNIIHYVILRLDCLFLNSKTDVWC